jgi:hypothetical protein
MKRFTIVTLVAALVLLLAQGPARACTSFAVYTSQPIYGMNFDYAWFPMKLRIVTKGDLRTFHLSFEKQFGETRFFADTGGMNSKGLFYACQGLYPVAPIPPEPKEGTLPLYLLNEMPENTGTIKKIEQACNNHHLVQIKGASIHTLFADKTGRAMVVETGKKQNILTHRTDNFIVMANFANHSLAGKSYKEAKGCGDYRYKIIHEYIEKNFEKFDVDHGLTVLEKAFNNSPDYPTTCSMVYAPETNSIYIAFRRDFTKIWKISLMEGTIETFRGFKTEIKRPLDQDGLLVSYLLNQSI